jgi:alpha-beta hydrolase superfamily lysophospholipase
LSHDQEFVRNFVNDPLTHTTKTSARLGYENIIGFSKTPIFASQLTLPVLFVRGADDKLIINAEPLIDALHMVDKTVKIYPGLYHDIFVEPEPLRREPMNDLVQWLDKHVK